MPIKSSLATLTRVLPLWLLTAGCIDQQPGVDISQCDIDRGLMPVQEVLDNPDDGCCAWVEALHGRAVRVDRGGGSASVWSRRTMHGTGIMTTAAHVLSPCLGNGNADGSCPELLINPATVPGEAFIRLAEAHRGAPSSRWSAHFPLYSPDSPPGELTSPDGLPRYDFSVYAVDSQSFEAWGTGFNIDPEPILDAPLSIYDPNEYTLDDPSWASAEPGGVLILGYPQIDEDVRTLHVSVARVLSDAEAEAAIVRLQAEGDEEGDIAYDREAEILLEGTALPGMSGSGIFDEDGRLVAITVRVSFAQIGVQFVRGVRMDYVVGRMDAAFESLPSPEQTAIAAYLETRD